MMYESNSLSALKVNEVSAWMIGSRWLVRTARSAFLLAQITSQAGRNEASMEGMLTPLTHALGPHCLHCVSAMLHAFVCSLAHFQTRNGRGVMSSNWMRRNNTVSIHCACTISYNDTSSALLIIRTLHAQQYPNIPISIPISFEPSRLKIKMLQTFKQHANSHLMF